MSIVIGSMMQETNSFSPVLTTLETFSANYLYYGEEIVLKLTGTRTEIGGFIDILHKEEKQIYPTLAAMAIAGGKVTADTFEHFKTEFLDRISKLDDIEGILLALHGAMLTDNSDDPEGELLYEIRKIVGPKVPIAISLDPHAHVTSKMVDSADIIVGYKTFPHVDHFETGERTASLLLKMLSGQLTPVMEMVKVPMLISPETQDDSSGPMSEIIGFCYELEKQENIQVANFFPVQPWLDIPHTGTTALILADSNYLEAKEAAKTLAEKAWSMKEEFLPKRLKPFEAVQYVSSKDKKGNWPFILSEPSDSTLAGAPGDGAFLLKALLEADFPEIAYVTIIDPDAVELAYSKTIGDPIELDIGFKLDSRWGKPVKVEGVVHLKSNGQFPLQQTGVTEHMGRTAVIKSGNIYIVVCEYSFAHLDPNSYSYAGLNPLEAKIVGVKSTLHFRAFYREIASEIILLETPGVSSGDFASFDWKALTRPCWPLDDIEWTSD